MNGHDETYGNTPGTYAGPGAKPRSPYVPYPTPRHAVFCRACGTEDEWCNQRRCRTCGATVTKD